MKILLLTYRGNPFCGGQGVYTVHLARELARLGHAVHVLQGPPYAPEEPGDGAQGIVWHRVPGLNLIDADGHYPPPAQPLAALQPVNLLERALTLCGQFPELTGFSLRAFVAVRRLLERQRFDVMHDNQSLGWGLLALRALGVPMVATVHHPLTIDRARGFDPPAGFRSRLDKVRFYPVLMQGMVARHMRRIVTVSQASAQAIAADFRVPARRIRVIYNGVDSQRFRPLPGVPRVPGRVLFVGNLEDPNKGGRYLLRAMARLAPPAHLVVATGGISQQHWLREQLDALHLRERVSIRYRVDPATLVELYASAQVAVSPSLFEGFGLPAAEAMACGLPLVAARGGALPEVVGDAGVLVPVADDAALADGIAALLADPSRREALGLAARRRVQERFRWEVAARELVDVYREAIHADH
jgi:glycosyltransferase involved in cell wall biosynthesis